MITVVYGGSGSGKSEFAENMAVRNACGPFYYIATMYPYDRESFAKIDRHREMRSGKNFETIEAFTDISAVEIEKGSSVLLECVSNLVANEMFLDCGAKENCFQSVAGGIDHLAGQAGHLVIVTNNIFEDGTEYEDETGTYMKALADVNLYICGRADNVFEVVHGIVIPVRKAGGGL
ncbi:bifunctional adenosylcobinamide kinase/adenosylcobinamide-phosphate guanylyltransferase [Parasporobacterium paucivorans]|uniref:Adenosylcobinamide kinase n=1 Tax=Parasporobacterium paucivorans DSM 15970 TaxID=1122934 RepID=A0A1M6KIB7_9FIRM|nr:bifunctional adenosylcobinamide kinase/adenosylcobinamide-phosphate guanylyltransferase [Parasporobacterium paucivorans]SHJ58675.1 adenosylcobinamide kinase /adenosylcobinamide-phosphate guanylyltransferase [Parasporobacterium paucivorans DSM 15970]